MAKLFLILAAVYGFLAVALGAFGSHWLKQRFDEYTLGIWQTANQYHFYHSCILLTVAVYLHYLAQPNKYITISAGLFSLGTMIFSGSLYILALSGLKWLGAVTPIGGILLLLAWLMLLIGVMQH